MAAITKVLIANRGEIALRLLSTVRAMGLASVVVYHEADAGSRAVREADEAVEIFGATPVGAYLDVASIIEACRRTGADAVHPGYGFLSENPALAADLARAGLRFIGPPAAAIRAMGDKITAKRIADEAGVRTIPGHPECLRDAADAVAAARAVGYPVMLKASAGGGGKAMRVAGDDAACREGFERATREARSSFGDGRVFLEKYIERPRHVEVQVLADDHGNVIHLGERECSLQRRHQKVVEEAPSPLLDEAARAAMGAQAVALARAVGYRSAGTVEFVVDAESTFFFLEMNTRLQVEHPVTEMVTGVDLVAEQIRIAGGAPVRFRQEDVAIRGHAVECRLYAEDPEHDFVPATGRVLVYQPAGGEGVRWDSGIEAGSAVTSAFDPLLAKLVTHGATREEAVARARQALAATILLGVTTNAAYLERVLGHPAFAAAQLDTGFLERYAAALRPPPATQDELAVILAAACLTSRAFTDARHRPPQPLSALGEWRN